MVRKKIKIIAEIGQNHNGDMKLAKKLIKSAKENGADFAKFQLFDAKNLFQRKNNPWYEYNCSTELTYENVKILNDECKKVGIQFMASVFDLERIKWLKKLNVKKIKIASRSINDKELINALLKTKIPLIISLGHWEKSHFPKLRGNVEGYLYCISKYPTRLKDLNFKNVNFNKYIGFSDHTIGLTAPIAAITLGAKYIEKHYTIDKKMYGPDHKGSMLPGELKKLSSYRDEFEKCL